MDIYPSRHGTTACGWVQHNLPWLAMLALLFPLFEAIIAGAGSGDTTTGEDG